MAELLAGLQARHPMVGAVRSIGLFGVVELVKDRATMEPLSPFGTVSPPMKQLSKLFRDNGLYTFVRFNMFFTNPPLSVSEADLRHGFDVIDRALTTLALG